MDTGRPEDKRLLSQINVTPLVDVMLVLLIIFMVTAPMMQGGVDVNLPKTESGALTSGQEPLVVTIDRQRRLYVNDKPFRAGELKSSIEAIYRAKNGAEVLLRADESVPYGVIMSTMAEIRKAGITKIGMVTEPLEEGR